MYKKAGVTAKSVSQFADILKANGVRAPKAAVDKALISKNTSGSFVLDFLTKNKLSRSSGYQRFQRKLADMDMKAGGKAYDFLDKRNGKVSKFAKNSLVQEHDILRGKGVNGTPDDLIRVKTTGILNPLAKAGDKAVPFVGSMALANLLLSEKEDGDKDVR